MKCKNCGTELEEGAVFCQSCGSKVEEAAAEEMKEEAAAEEKKAEPAAEEKKEETAAEEKKEEEKPSEEKKEAASEKTEEVKAQEAEKAPEQAQAASQPQAPQQGQAASQAPQQGQAAPQAQDAQRKKSKALPIIIAAAAVVVLAVVIGLCVKLFSGFSGGRNSASTMAVYLSRNTLVYTPDATATEPKLFEICDIEMDKDIYYIPDNLVTITDDEKYIYFFNDVDADGCADLCRVQTGKLGKDKDKNEKKIEEIDDNVMISSLRLLNGGRVAYVTGKGKLMIFNGKESVEIQKDVTYPYVIKDGKAIVYLGEEDKDGYYTLFCLDISKTEAEALEEEVSYISSVDDNGVYFCVEDRDNYTSSLSFYSFSDGSTVEITDDYSYGSRKTDNGFYFIGHAESEVCLYDYIKDPYASDDEKVTEPVYPDYSDGFIPASSMDAFDEYKMDRIVKRYNGDPIAYMENNCSVSTYHEVRYYYIWNSDTGVAYYYDIAGDKFYTYDDATYSRCYEQYTSDSEKWYEAQNRIYLRQALKDYTFDPGYVTLNYFHDGKVEELVEKCDGVTFTFSESNPMAVYHTSEDDDVEKISIDEITYAYEAYDRLFGYGSGDYEKKVYVAIGSEAGIALDLEGQIQDVTYSEDEGRFAIAIDTLDKNGVEERNVYLYSLKGTTFTLDSKFDDEAECVAAFEKGQVFFIKGVDRNSMEGDLYIYDGKNTTRLIKNVNLYNYGYVYESGSMICYKDTDAILYNKAGEEIVKLGEIEYLYRNLNYISDKKIVFLSGDKLRFYNGKEIIKIANSVDRIWFSRTGDHTQLGFL
ncbi:MAG: zinc ribbon domain-containing protein [Lachnospiraceae bacterium]|nr:zinc ribbon domain-containing protein [Lachnospiraceae bacterium]